MGIGQAQTAFPDVAKGSKAVARVFRGKLSLPRFLVPVFHKSGDNKRAAEAVHD